MMKLKLIAAFYLIAFNANTSEKYVREEISFIGNWQMCKNFEDGIETNRNHCLKITFHQNGLGSTEEANFKWDVKDSIVRFSFNSIEDRNRFISKDSIFTFEIYEKNKVHWLNLKNLKAKSWYLLGKVEK